MKEGTFKGTPIYARDLVEWLRTNEGIQDIEEKIIEANEKGTDVVVGYFIDKPFIEE